MVTIPIQAEEDVLVELEEIARQQQTTVQAVAKEALLHYLRERPPHRGTYSFVGIWHSGKVDLSQQVETGLEQAANRREGWSLAE
jgi:hypothetical protein